MEQRKVNKLVKFLNKLDSTDLNFLSSTIDKSNRSDISIEEASTYTKFQPGTTVAFYDRDKNSHQGVIRKVNQKWIRVFDNKEKIEYYVLPESIRPVRAQRV